MCAMCGCSTSADSLGPSKGRLWELAEVEILKVGHFSEKPRDVGQVEGAEVDREGGGEDLLVGVERR